MVWGTHTLTALGLLAILLAVSLAGCPQLSPTFGGPLNRVVPLRPKSRGDEDEGPVCMAYSTADRVIGLVMLPLDGNPNGGMGLIAHPQEVRL